MSFCKGSRSGRLAAGAGAGLIAWGIIGAATAAAQTTTTATMPPPATTVPPTPRGPAKVNPPGLPSRSPTERWREDHSALADPAKRTSLFAPLKYIPLVEGEHPTYLTIGGEYRLRFDDFGQNAAFGLRGIDDDDYLQQRVMVNADLHIDTFARIFVELSDTRTWGKEAAVSATDQSRTELQQAFFDLSAGTSKSSALTLRTGLQEIPLGSGRLLGVRDAPNQRRSYDGLRGMFDASGYAVSAFWTRPVLNGPESFDDESDDSIEFKGIYATLPVVKGKPFSLSTDVYALNYDRDTATFLGRSGEEDRNTFGVRLFGAWGNLDYNWELIYQSGQFGNQDISAYALGSDTGYTFADVALKPRLGVKLDYATGDDKRTDNKLNTFNPLFPNNAYFSLASLTGFSNLQSVFPSVRVQPVDELTLSAGADLLWRQSENDSVYMANMVAAPRTNLNTEDRIGTAYVLEANWRPLQYITVVAQYVNFDAGEAITVAGGDDVDFFQLRTTLRF